MEAIAFQLPMVIDCNHHKSSSSRTPQSPLQYICEKHRKWHVTQRQVYRVPIHCAFDGQSESYTSVKTESSEMLPDTTIITVQLPLDAYLDETMDGRIFVDELVAGGNAESSGLLLEGDVIVAVSLPFGDGLFPVPDSNGLEMIESYIESREGDTFRLAVVRTSSVQDLRSQSAEKSENALSFSKHLECMREIHTPEYPIIRPYEDNPSPSDPDFVPNLEALREYGFDIDNITGSSQRES